METFIEQNTRGNFLLAATAALLLIMPNIANAACSTPTANEGAIIYNSTYHVLQFCNGSDWINAGGGGGGGSEVDPEVGTLNASKWCAANAGATAIVCDQNAPSGGGGNNFAFQVNRTTTLNQSSWAKVNFDDEEHDPASVFDITTDRYLPTQAGYYYISFYGASSTCGSGQRIWIAIRKNGSELTEAMNVGDATTTYASANASRIAYLNGTTDYIEFWADETCGSFDANGLQATAFKVGS